VGLVCDRLREEPVIQRVSQDCLLSFLGAVMLYWSRCSKVVMSHGWGVCFLMTSFILRKQETGDYWTALCVVCCDGEFPEKWLWVTFVTFGVRVLPVPRAWVWLGVYDALMQFSSAYCWDKQVVCDYQLWQGWRLMGRRCRKSC